MSAGVRTQRGRDRPRSGSVDVEKERPAGGDGDGSGAVQARRVLVADDTRPVATLVQQILSAQGYEVDIAEDGEQAVAKAREFRPDLILMDITMPKLHGIDALRRIRADEDQKVRDVGVIMCTLKDYKPDQTSAKELGCAGYIVKPFRREELIEKVEDFFRGSLQAGAAIATSPTTQPAAEFFPAIQPGTASFRLWGTRGSVPVSGQAYVRHGGNTSCVSFDCGDEYLIFDAGTGIRELGEHLVSRGPRRIHLFITHTHWDHIQGFPFFIPAYVPGYELVIYGAAGFGKDLESVFAGQLDRHYFPVQLEDMRAHFEFRHLSENPVRVGDHKVHWEYTHHPGAAVAYKAEVNGKRVGYISDNEFLKGYMGPPDRVGPEVLAPYGKLVAFAGETDVLLAEAQYTNEEYRTKIGWGHSSLTNACLLATLARVPRWIVTHHDPRHTDDFLHQKLLLTRQVLAELGGTVRVENAFDGLSEYL